VGAFEMNGMPNCSESGCVMLIGIKHIGLDLDQFTVALFAIHAPMGNLDIIPQGLPHLSAIAVTAHRGTWHQKRPAFLARSIPLAHLAG